MSLTSRFVPEGLVLVLAVAAAAGCTKPMTVNGGSGGGGTTGATGSGGSSGQTTGAGGTATTTGTGGTATTTGAGGSTTATGTGGATTGTGSGGATTGTGSGGATGASGGTTGGGGTTDAAVVQKLCATKTVVMNPVFMNFENYNGMVTAANYDTAFGSTTVNTGNAYAGIYAYPEATGTTAPTLSILAGHPPSTWAGAETLSATMWGMGGGIWMGCADASAYKGITFWVRGTSGTGTFSFTIAMESTVLPDMTNPAGGGTCPGTSDTCKSAEKDGIALTADWTQVQLLWSDFTPGMSGTAEVTPDGNNITGFGWTVPLAFEADPTQPDAGVYIPVPGNMVINIDDVGFMQ